MVKSKISVNTLMKYTERLTRIVEERLKDIMPPALGIIIDGWTEAHVHYMAIFGTFKDPSGKLVLPLLSCSPMGDETSQGAEAFLGTLDFVMDLFGKSRNSIVFMVSDNTELNPSIARKLKIPFIGCMSHRLALAVNDYLNKTDVVDLLDNVHKVMLLLSNVNLRGQLRKKFELEDATFLAPVLRNATRWSSTFSMLQRFLREEFYNAVVAVSMDQTCFKSRAKQYEFQKLLPDADEIDQLKILLDQFKLVNEVTVYLQTSNINVLDAQEAIMQLLDDLGLPDNESGFDGDYDPATATWNESITYYCCDNYLPDDERSRPFVNGVTAILKDPMDVQDLSAESKFYMESFKTATSATPTNTISPVKPTDSITVKVRKTKKLRLSRNEEVQRVSSTMYHNLDTVLATSNACERLFSTAGRTLTPLRRSMKPSTLEMLLFLNANREFWDVNDVRKSVFQDPSN